MRTKINLLLIATILLVSCQSQEKISSTEPPETIIQIITQTDTINHSGTDSKVGVYINNKSGKFFRLDTPDFNDYQNASQHSYTITSDIGIDEINSLILAVHGNDAWRVKNVKVRLFSYAKQTQEEYKFPLNQWFSSEQKDMDEVGAIQSKVLELKIN